jgi:RHS repeat-associated protein
MTVDSLGRTTGNQISGLLATNFSYDGKGRVATISQGGGIDQRLMTFTYNPQGWLQNAVDAENRVLSLTYDAAGRIQTETRPDGKVIAYGYDANGNIASLTPPGNPAHGFGFSPVNLRSSYLSPAVAGGGTNQMTYAYNLDRQLDSITRADGGIIDYAYDSAGRLSTLTIPSGVYTSAYSPSTSKLASIAAPGGVNLAFTYDGALLTGNTWNGSLLGSVTRTYDNNFRLTNLAVNGSGIAFTYDNDDLLTQAGALTQTYHAQHGLLTGSTLNTISDTWSFNGFAEATGYSATAGGSPLFSTQYSRDKLGRITQKVETVGGATDTYDYIYDLAGRLSQVKKNNVTTGSYSYDDNGNRLTGPGFSAPSYDDQDRLLSHNGNISYSYSADGELATKSVGAATTNFQYDALGNLRSVSLPGGAQIDYLVDGQNRRVGKRVNSILTQGFLYEDQLRVVAETDGSHNVVSRFVYASRVNVPDYMVKAGVSYRIITDDVGSVRLVVNAATGAVIQRLDYDEFGKVTLDTNPGFQPFGFAGGLYDTHTGLVRFGARDYDSATGRFTVKDFLRFAGRSSNLYEYAFSDPINHFDPDGLCPIGIKLTKGKYKKGFGFGIGIRVGPLHGGISFGVGTQSGSNSSTTVTPTGTITQTSTSSSTGIGTGVGIGVGSHNIGGNFGTGVSSTSSSTSVSVSESQQAAYNEQVQQWIQTEQQMLNQQ